MEIKGSTEIYNKEVTDLIVTIQPKEFNIPVTLDAQPDLKNIPQFYQQGNGNFWVAISDNVIVGTIALSTVANSDAALRKMFVKAAFRGNNYGEGQALLNTIFEWATQNKMNNIFLGTTEKFVAAQRF